MNILWGFENIFLPWEYLQKDYKHLIRLHAWALEYLPKDNKYFMGFQTVPRPSKYLQRDY
jgi:hypothetical protein